MYFGSRLLLQCVIVADPGNISRYSPVVEFLGSLIKGMVLQHWSDNGFLEPGGERLNWCGPCGQLRINMEDVRGTSQAIVGSEGQDCTVVQ